MRRVLVAAVISLAMLVVFTTGALAKKSNGFDTLSTSIIGPDRAVPGNCLVVSTWFPDESVAVDHYEYIVSDEPIKTSKKVTGTSTTGNSVVRSIAMDGTGYLALRITPTSGKPLAWWVTDSSGWTC